MRKVLLIAHHFPPLGGAGVQRSVKLAKYLQDHEVLPVVLTGSGRSAKWSPLDGSLLSDVPSNVEVHRAADLDNGAAPQASMIALACQIGRECGADALVVSMSPFSHAAVAATVAKTLGIPWIADLRDPWALDEFQVHRTALHRLVSRTRMTRALSTAAAIIGNTPEAANRIRQLPGFGSKYVVAIPNGYDPEDFQGSTPVLRNQQFTVVHAGHLHTAAGLHQSLHTWQYALLGRVQRGVRLLPRSHVYLLRAIERAVLHDPSMRQRIRVKLVGQLSDADLSEIDRSAVSSLVEPVGYVSHERSLQYLRTADMLFLPMHQLRPGQRSTIVPGKTYEYMASGRPILAAVPDGDAKDYLSQCGTATICAPDDIEGMQASLSRRYRAWSVAAEPDRVNEPFVRQFARQHTAGAFAHVIHSVCAAL